jgi:2-hydroxycyclohexanecarboxyl-CoA dehydrogenase
LLPAFCKKRDSAKAAATRGRRRRSDSDSIEDDAQPLGDAVRPRAALERRLQGAAAMNSGLDGKVAFVSGAARGIGRAIALGLAREGAAVAVAWRHDETNAGAVVAEIERAGGRALAVQLDQRDPASIAAAIARTQAALGAVAVLVANAVDWPQAEADESAALARSLATNAVGTFALVEAALPSMRAGGWGRIVLVSSDIVGQPTAGDVAYAGAKAALEGIGRVLAVREARHGILTNIVRPGLTLTEKALESASLPEAALAFERNATPTGRLSTAEDVASAVIYLASAANGHVNGQTLAVSGGRELKR